MEPKPQIVPAFRALFFNPGQLQPAQLESIYIARQDLFQNILADILAERNDAAPQHHMIIGQRGMGKTTLLHRLAVELNKVPHCDRFIPLTFPEEQHVIVERLSDFWLNALDALAAALELRKKTPAALELDAVIKQLPKQHPLEAELANAARRELMERCTALGLRPVLLLDNFPLLLRKLEASQWDLRALLQAAGAPIVVAAGLALPESLGNYDAAFFDMFRARVLYNLTLEECRKIYHTMAEREGRPDVITKLAQHEGRLKTLHLLTGGNPRTVGLLYDLFVRGLGQDAWEDLRALLDSITPLYQTRLEQLSDRGQQIFAALALTWEPVPQHVIEQKTKLTQGTLSSTLLRLEESGVVERVEIFGQKKLGWQVAERFFNIWFLMRFASRRTQGSISALASFLELFYSPDELHGIASNMTGRALDEEQAHFTLALSTAMGSNATARDLCTHAQLQILQFRDQNNSLFDLDVPSEVVDFFEFRDRILPSIVPPDAGIEPTEFARLVVSGISLLNGRAQFKTIPRATKTQVHQILDDLKETRQHFAATFGEPAVEEVEQRLYRGLLTDIHNQQQWDDAVESASQPFTAVFLASLMPESYFESKEKAFRKAILLDGNDARLWNDFGNILTEKSSHYAEAEAAYRKAIELDATYASPWNNLGILMHIKLGRYEEAEDAYRKATQLRPTSELWTKLALLLHQEMSRYDEAEVAYRKAIKSNPTAATPRGMLGILLHTKLQRYAEAEDLYREAISLDAHNPLFWLMLGLLLGETLTRYEEAECAYRKALELDTQNTNAWTSLALLLTNKLHRYKDAEIACRKALEIEEKNILRNTLGILYSDFLNNPKEAEICYRKSLELNPADECAKQNLIFLLRDQLGRSEEAERLFSEIDPTTSVWPEEMALHLATFALRKENIGEAKDHLKEALGLLGGQFKPNSVDDWYRTAAAWLMLGRGEPWLEVWESTGAKELYLPFHEAVRAHQLGDIRFLNNIPKEVRPAAEEIFREIERRRNNLTKK